MFKSYQAIEMLGELEICAGVATMSSVAFTEGVATIQDACMSESRSSMMSCQEQAHAVNTYKKRKGPLKED